MRADREPLCAAGTIEDRIEEGRRSARMMVAITAAGAAACVLAMSAVALTPARPAALYASMDKRDGSDALVNAILVARGSRCALIAGHPQRRTVPPPPPSRLALIPGRPLSLGWRMWQRQRRSWLLWLSSGRTLAERTPDTEGLGVRAGPPVAGQLCTH